MRIIQYGVKLDGDRKNVLVKELSKNYPMVTKLNHPDGIAMMMRTAFDAGNLAEEHAWIIAFDTKLNLIGVFEVSHGSVNASITNPREIFTRLCLCGASSFALVHNHPSGSTSPSLEDTATKDRIRQCGNLMGIKLIDSIIVGEGYYSYAMEGKL